MQYIVFRCIDLLPGKFGIAYFGAQSFAKYLKKTQSGTKLGTRKT